jgi:hypothetical protein
VDDCWISPTTLSAAKGPDAELPIREQMGPTDHMGSQFANIKPGPARHPASRHPWRVGAHSLHDWRASLSAEADLLGSNS